METANNLTDRLHIQITKVQRTNIKYIFDYTCYGNKLENNGELQSPLW